MRLRQIALVGKDLEACKTEIYDVLGLGQDYPDPGVGHFGLHNAVWPVGDTFLEVVAPKEAGTSAERLQFVLRAAVQVLLDRLPYVTLLLRVRGNSAVERAALERRRAFDHEMALLVREAQASGSVRPDVDSAIVTRLIFGMLNSTIEWYRPTGPIDRDALTHDILTVAFDGISSH